MGFIFGRVSGEIQADGAGLCNTFVCVYGDRRTVGFEFGRVFGQILNDDAGLCDNFADGNDYCIHVKCIIVCVSRHRLMANILCVCATLSLSLGSTDACIHTYM
jgi:hypothetical protein